MIDKDEGVKVGHFHFRKISLAAVLEMDYWGPGWDAVRRLLKQQVE